MDPSTSATISRYQIVLFTLNLDVQLLLPYDVCPIPLSPKETELNEKFVTFQLSRQAT
jgi:hypothetical protein